jgi:hypothetical protein
MGIQGSWAYTIKSKEVNLSPEPVIKCDVFRVSPSLKCISLLACCSFFEWEHGDIKRFLFILEDRSLVEEQVTNSLIKSVLIYVQVGITSVPILMGRNLKWESS